MRPRRPPLRSRRLAALVVALTLGAAAHRLGRTWGSTPAERKRPMPGDDIVPRPFATTMHAVTVDAPPDAVWPWIAQMGYHRAGWYTYPWVDRWIWHIDNPSADRIIPELQDLAVGGTIPDGEPGTAFYVIKRLSPPHVLVLHSTTHVPPRLRGRMRVSWTWGFLLEPLAPARTRLMLRVRVTGNRVTWLLTHLLVVPSDFVMARSMLVGIARRAESSTESAAGSPIEPAAGSPAGPPGRTSEER